MDLAKRLRQAADQAPGGPQPRLLAAAECYLRAVLHEDAPPEHPDVRSVLEMLVPDLPAARALSSEAREHLLVALWSAMVGAARLGQSLRIAPEAAVASLGFQIVALVNGAAAQSGDAALPRPPAPPPSDPAAVAGPGGPNPYEYTNYRDYLRDWFIARDGRPSQRAFAGRVGVSPSFLTTVLHGDRDLNPWDAERVVDQLGLDERGRAYILDMVEYNQPGPASRRAAAFDRMSATRRFIGAARPVDLAWALFRQWYVPAVAELVRCAGFQEDPEWIAATLRPPIRPEEARSALDTLLAIGMLERDRTGRLVQATPVMVTDHEVSRAQGVALGAWHLWMLGRAAEVLDTLPPSERHFGGLTAAVSPELLAELKDRMARFTEEVVSRCENHPGPADRVYQLSLQLMPLSAVTGS